MLDIKFIRENKDIVKESARKKRVEIDIDELISLDDKRLELMKITEGLRAEQNAMSTRIASTKDENARAQMIMEMKGVKDEFTKSEDELRDVLEKLQKIMLAIPNIPSPDTPEGPDESGNVIVRSWGEIPQFSFTPKEHFELGEKLGIINIETAGKIAGSRFAYLMGDLARMQFAIVQYCFNILTNESILSDIAKEAGANVKIKPFIPVVPPVFVRPVVQVKMARFMKPEDHYLFPDDDLMLVGSAEHTLGPMHMDQIFSEDELPVRYIGYSTAFRREAGTYGKDMKGILRVHQFDKLEMEVFGLPENSIDEQNFLVALQEHLLRSLKLPYQVMSICTGDMGFPDYRQIDINTWMPGQNQYRETHTSDLTGGFQSRRLNTRVKRADGKTEPVHMNDATYVAIGRLLIAIMENYQNEDGTINVPEVLIPFLGKNKIG